MIDSINIHPLHLVSFNKLFRSPEIDVVLICYAMRCALTPYGIKGCIPYESVGLSHLGNSWNRPCNLSKVTQLSNHTTSIGSMEMLCDYQNWFGQAISDEISGWIMRAISPRYSAIIIDFLPADIHPSYQSHTSSVIKQQFQQNQINQIAFKWCSKPFLC